MGDGGSKTEPSETGLGNMTFDHAKAKMLALFGLALTALAGCSGGPSLDERVADLETRVTAQEAALDDHLKKFDSAAAGVDPSTLSAAVTLLLANPEFRRALTGEAAPEAEAAAPAATPASKTPPPKPPEGYTSAGAQLDGGEPFQATPVAIPRFQGPAGLHLVSYADAQNLRPGWALLQRSYSDILGGLDVLVEYVTVQGGKPFLRLKAGPIASAAEAGPYCVRLRARGAYCEILPFTGNSIETYEIAP